MIWTFFILNAHMFWMLLFSNIQNRPIRENIVIHLFDCVFNCCLHHKMWCFGIKQIKRNGYFVAWHRSWRSRQSWNLQELLKLTGRKWKTQSKYSDEDRYTIAKYAEDNGASQAAKFCKNKYPT